MSSQLCAQLIEIKSVADYDQQIKTGHPTVIKFFAHWCGACVANAPLFDALIKDPSLASIDFALIDVDKLPEIAQRENIHSIPAFIYFHKGEKKGETIGGQDPSAFDSFMRHEIKTKFFEPETVAQPKQAEQSSGTWQSIKQGFNQVIDGIVSAGKYIGKKVKNLFS